MSRATTTATTRLNATCLRCAWTTLAANGLGNAARHHDATGHPVRVEVDRVINYGDPAAPPPGQGGLFDREEGTPAP